MKQLVEHIISKEYELANTLLENEFETIMRKKLHEMKKMTAAKSLAEDDMDKFDDDDKKPEPKKAKKYRHETSGKEIMHVGTPPEGYKPVNEENEEQLDEAQRIKIVKARIRGGKIQRRTRVSNIPGYTMRGGKLVRMSPQERRKRKLGQRKGKIKRKIKMQRALMKRKRSLMKRRAIGLR